MHALSLHHLTMTEVSPVDLIDIAAETGYQHVCLFTEVAGAYAPLFPATRDPATVREVIRRSRDTGVGVYNIEFFPLTPEVKVADFAAGLEIGARLGGRRATAIINDADDGRAADNFARLCELGAAFNLQVGLEFMPLSMVKTLAHARRILAAAGHPNGSIALDPLHLMRSGGSPADLAGLDPALIGYVQICDGPLDGGQDYLAEAIGNRQVPGDGQFPLEAFVAAVPADAILSVEVPLNRLRDAGVAPRERARLALAGARRVLAGAREAQA